MQALGTIEVSTCLLRIYTYIVYVKKNATNVPRRHLKTWWQVRRLSPTKSAALWCPCRSAPSCKAPRNPWIAAPFAVKMWRVRRIVAHFEKISARLEKSAAILYPGTYRYLIRKYHIGWIFRITWNNLYCIIRNITLGGYLESRGTICIV